MASRKQSSRSKKVVSKEADDSTSLLQKMMKKLDQNERSLAAMSQRLVSLEGAQGDSKRKQPETSKKGAKRAKKVSPSTSFSDDEEKAPRGDHDLYPPSPEEDNSEDSDSECEVSQNTLQKEMKRLLRGTEEEREGEVFASLLLGGAHLKKSIQKEIWSGQYIDLSTLAPSSQDEQDEGLAQRGSQLHFVTRKGKKPKTFEEWLKLFLIFSSVYCQRYPRASPELFTYIGRISSMARNTTIPPLTWRLYDEKFRRFKAKAHKAPWHLVRQHLYNDAQEECGFAPSASGVSKKNQSNSSNARDKVCFAYNKRDQRCTKGLNCPYSHMCSICKDPKDRHPSYHCSASGRNSQQDSRQGQARGQSS